MTTTAPEKYKIAPLDEVLEQIPLTITAEQKENIRRFLVGRYIPHGLGDVEAACSVASINLALDGRIGGDAKKLDELDYENVDVRDDTPACMSPVIAGFIITVQDAIPDEIRNAPSWRRLLPYAAGTGQAATKEKARLKAIADWYFETVLPVVAKEVEYFYGPEALALFEEARTKRKWTIPARKKFAFFDETDELPSKYLKRLETYGTGYSAEDYGNLINYGAEFAKGEDSDYDTLDASGYVRGTEESYWKKVKPAEGLYRAIVAGYPKIQQAAA
jgi:hypothetical protein